MFGNGVFTTHFYVYEQGNTAFTLLIISIFPSSRCKRSHGIMVSTLDSEFSDPSSNLGGTCQDFFLFITMAD